MEQNTESAGLRESEEAGIPERQLADAVLTISERIFYKHGLEKGCQIISEVSKVVEVIKEWPEDIAEDCLMVFIESIQDITALITKQGSEVRASQAPSEAEDTKTSV